jgi:hypothetical protein
MRSLSLLIVLALSSAFVVPVTSGGEGARIADDTTAWSEPDVVVATPVADDPDEFGGARPAIDSRQGATDTVAVNGSNQTRILSVPNAAIRRTEMDHATLTLGPSTRFAGNISAVRMETAAVERYVTAPDDEDEQSRRIIESFSTVEQEVITLRGRQQAAVEAFNNEEITPREFVVELATISARADALEDRVTMLEDRARDIEGFSLSRADQKKFELRAFGGPVRERAVDAIQGTEPATRFFLTTGPEGYELTTIDDGVYVREAFRGAVRSGDASARMEPTTAINITQRRYPNITSSGSASASVSGMTSIVTVTTEKNTLTTFIDSGSERVFKEYQRIPIATFQSGPAATNVLNGLRITVNRTYPGGPIRIHVAEAESGEPVNLTVTLSQGPTEGIEIGRTGEDGTLWTLSPRGTYTVTAVGEETAATFIETNSTEAPAI